MQLSIPFKEASRYNPSRSLLLPFTRVSVVGATVGLQQRPEYACHAPCRADNGYTYSSPDGKVPLPRTRFTRLCT